MGPPSRACEQTHQVPIYDTSPLFSKTVLASRAGHTGSRHLRGASCIAAEVSLPAKRRRTARPAGIAGGLASDSSPQLRERSDRQRYCSKKVVQYVGKKGRTARSAVGGRVRQLPVGTHTVCR